MIVVAGEALIDLVLPPDGTVRAIPGGGPFNTARTIARLGGEVAFLGRLSVDRFGRRLRATLEADGVDLRWAPSTDDPTTLAVAEIDEGGGATYRFHLGGTSAPGLSVDEVAGALAGRPDAVHVGSLGLAIEPCASAIAEALARLPPETPVMVDVNARPSAIDDRATYVRRLDRVLARADVVKVSREDLAYLAPGSRPESAAAGLLARTSGLLLVTDGDRPVHILGQGWAEMLPVPQVEVVDTVGCGDAFGGGFLARWIELGHRRPDLADPEAVADATLVGIEVAGLTGMRVGAEPPHRDEVAGLATR